MNLPNDFIDNIFLCVLWMSCVCRVPCAIWPPFTPLPCCAEEFHLTSLCKTMAIAAVEICQWCGGRNVKFSSLFWWTTEQRERKSFTTENGSKKLCVAGPPCRWKRWWEENLCVYNQSWRIIIIPLWWRMMTHHRAIADVDDQQKCALLSIFSLLVLQNFHNEPIFLIIYFIASDGISTGFSLRARVKSNRENTQRAGAASERNVEVFCLSFKEEKKSSSHCADAAVFELRRI